MNHLAHFLLSYDDEDLLCGNFIADRVKGKAFEAYPEEVKKGILLHREIDRYTDSHAIVSCSKRRLFPKYRHYSAVIVDMFYDHFLAVQWEEYSPIPLHEFAVKCYEILLSRNDLPATSEFMLHYMHEQDWLSNYAEKEGIERALTGLSNRASFESNMEKSVEDLYQDYDEYAEEFNLFFPQLVRHCDQWMEMHQS